MTTYTRVNTLKINRLTKAQYSTITPSETELYVITDEGETLPVQTGQSGKFLTTNGTTASWVDAPTEIPAQTGNSGKFLTTNGSSVSWANTPTEIPAQSGQSGKFLTTNGSSVSWATVDALPSQASQSGKFLTTNGSSASWATVDALPSQSGQSGKFLTTNGTTASWADGGSLPSQSGYSGAYLTTDGTTASWQTTTQIYPVISTYRNGSAWYRIYATDSTGYKWCEQGGMEVRSAATQDVYFSKAYIDSPQVLLSIYHTADSTDGRPPLIRNVTTTGFTLNIYTAYAGAYWVARGYISS